MRAPRGWKEAPASGRSGHLTIAAMTRMMRTVRHDALTF